MWICNRSEDCYSVLLLSFVDLYKVKFRYLVGRYPYPAHNRYSRSDEEIWKSWQLMVPWRNTPANKSHSWSLIPACFPVAHQFKSTKQWIRSYQTLFVIEQSRITVYTFHNSIALKCAQFWNGFLYNPSAQDINHIFMKRSKQHYYWRYFRRPFSCNRLVNRNLFMEWDQPLCLNWIMTTVAISQCFINVVYFLSDM